MVQMLEGVETRRSTLLFILVADTVNRMIKLASENGLIPHPHTLHQ